MARSQAGGGRRVDWFAAGLGLVLSVVIQLVGGTLLFGNHRGPLVSQGLLTFGALLAGGLLAGFVGPLSGAVWNGVIVAVGFIAVEELAGAMGPVGPLGSAGLDTVGLVIDDVLVLSACSSRLTSFLRTSPGSTSTVPRPSSSNSARARSSPRCCWRTRSTEPRPRPSRLCSKRWRSGR